MELFFMKQDALEMLKAALPDLYLNYFKKSDNAWLYDYFRENGIEKPFEKYTDVDEFQLADPEQANKGKIDYENCKTIYLNLMFLTPSQAADERFWAGIGHTIFYKYLKQRWNYYPESIEEEKKAVSNIKTRYFFQGGVRAGFYRNTLAKCWWVGKSVYDNKNVNDKFEKLSFLGESDLVSKISDIYFNNTFVSNQEIMDGIFMALKYFKEHDIHLVVKKHIRPAMQSLNAYGGRVVLDCLTKEEICEKVKSDILKLLNERELDVEIRDSMDE